MKSGSLESVLKNPRYVRIFFERNTSVHSNQLNTMKLGTFILFLILGFSDSFLPHLQLRNYNHFSGEINKG